MKELIPVEIIERNIYLIRSHKVMLSSDLAELYGVVLKVLIQAVKRNIERFPTDFMFQLSNQEFVNLKSQIVTSSWGGIRRAAPYAFTAFETTFPKIFSMFTIGIFFRHNRTANILFAEI